MASASFSRETMPLLRALVAYPMISSIMALGLWSGSKNIRPSFFTAPTRVRMGVVTITAPMVPLRTMMAAVTWAMSFTFPPSITRPPTMPPSARIRPPIDAKSILPPDFFAATGPLSAIGFVRSVRLAGRRSGICPAQRTTEGAGNDRPPELDNALHHFLGRLQDHDLLARGQGHDRIRGDLHVLDEIRVQDQRDVIQACELDHFRQP